MLSTLVLNASYEPLAIVSAKRAVLLLLQGKASSLDDSTVTMSSSSNHVPVPYVLLLNEYKRVSTARKPAPWTRRGVLARDGFRCVYCGNKATTIDHVLPVSRGGKNSYENCVAACQPCNLKKGNKTLSMLGWTLPFTPKAPTTYTLMLGKIARSEHRVHAAQLSAWTPYFTALQPELALMVKNS